MKYVGYSILGIIVLLALAFGLRYFGLVQYKFFAPKYEKARREVFENTQSYVEGKRQELTKYRLEYMKADSSDKEAIKMTIVQSFANFDEELLTGKLKSFLIKMKYE